MIVKMIKTTKKSVKLAHPSPLGKVAHSTERGLSPSPSLGNLSWKCGFTFAEVLITLAVISVVVAVTLPLIINQTQKFILKQQFKKTLNTINQAILKTYADLEYIPECYYESSGGPTNSECSIFHEKLLENLIIIKSCKKAVLEGCLKNVKSLDGNVYNDYYLNNSKAVIISDSSVLMLRGQGESAPIYLIDINGIKKPNKWGYDIYSLILRNKRLDCYYEFTEEGGTTCTEMIKNF